MIRKRYMLIGTMVIAAIAAIAVLLFVLIGTEEVNIEYLESMQVNPPENYIQELMSIVNDNPDPYIRERAIFTLTDVTMRRNETEEIIGFLKDVAMSEDEDGVRTAAYTNIDLIRKINPLEEKGSLELSVSGDIKKGGNIALIAEVSSTIDLEEVALIGIASLDNNIELLSSTGYQKVYLRANEPKAVKFDLGLKEIGRYVIPVTLKLSFDRIDYEKVLKRVYLVVDESSGEFSVH